MFYQMITNARNRWFASSECTAQGIIAYIEKANQMRDAQIDAIKTYLYLKIACGCAPLAKLFCQGAFNTLDLEQEELSAKTRTFLLSHPAAAALFEYACLKTDSGEQVSEKLEKQIRKDPESINYEDFFQSAFYGVSYTDYLFSLPMGAGKTYLMAAFIYLDLYFAKNEPYNPAFAHNFMIFAPSGLKSSVVPSLKTIQRFDPSWVIPQPAASEIKRQISFEVLDQGKTANKSNKTKNPNVQKIANHQPLPELFGLVAVTNAEKVIYDHLEEENMQLSLFKKDEQAKIRQSKELRDIIGKIPNMSIFIDEVHHASAAGDSKLRAVVTRWAKENKTNSVVGFSGTPYLEKAEKIYRAGRNERRPLEYLEMIRFMTLVRNLLGTLSDLADYQYYIDQSEDGIAGFFGNKVINNFKISDGTFSNSEIGIYNLLIGMLDDAESTILASQAQTRKLLTKSEMERYEKAYAAYLSIFEKLDPKDPRFTAGR